MFTLSMAHQGSRFKVIYLTTVTIGIQIIIRNDYYVVIWYVN